MPWFKGNLHTHTNKSDGDSSPEIVVDWYSNNKYDFLVLSDHNHLTILDSDQTKLLLCLLYTSPSPRDRTRSRMPSSA